MFYSFGRTNSRFSKPSSTFTLPLYYLGHLYYEGMRRIWSSIFTRFFSACPIRRQTNQPIGSQKLSRAFQTIPKLKSFSFEFTKTEAFAGFSNNTEAQIKFSSLSRLRKQKLSRAFQTIQKLSRAFQTIRKLSRAFQTIQNLSRAFQTPHKHYSLYGYCRLRALSLHSSSNTSTHSLLQGPHRTLLAGNF